METEYAGMVELVDSEDLGAVTSVKEFWIQTAGEGSAAYICGYDEIGKHAGFRFQCREACGFESHYPYHDYMTDF